MMKIGKLAYQKIVCKTIKPKESEELFKKPKVFKQKLKRKSQRETSSTLNIEVMLIFLCDGRKEKRAVQGKQTKNDEIIHKYIEEFFSEV